MLPPFPVPLTAPHPPLPAVGLGDKEAQEVVLVPVLDHGICGCSEGKVSAEITAQQACHHPAAYASSISALAPHPPAQPGLDLIDSLWPVDSMPVLSTCGG